MSTPERRKPYPFDLIEPAWQRAWAERGTFKVPNPGDPGFDATRPKYYVLDMFPYPSGAGLHVGHPEGYTATDIIGRYKTMRGFNVLHPMGWDAFGLPAEQYAIKTGQHPALTTAQNVAHFKGQLQRIGFGYDWSREVNTTDAGYMRWTQWIFVQLYRSWFNPKTQRAESVATYEGTDVDSVRLAYVSEAPVNWCPELGTVLANEEVIDGKSEVGGHPVERRPMRQWMLRITAFAQRLIDELEGLDWPVGIKLLQQNWIGRSEGAEVRFAICRSEPNPDDRFAAEGMQRILRGTYAEEHITVFTTRPDTLYGATYMVLAPEHRLVEGITTEEQWPDVRLYREKTARKSDLDRTELAKEKSGVWTGAFALNPVNGERIPIWIADYVLPGYGTGAIMAVPAHDERDWEFARKFALPIRAVVSETPTLGLGGGSSPCEAEPLECFVGEGFAIHSGPLDGLPTQLAKVEIIARLEEGGIGKKTITYKLRDWLFSRQRYWGEPFPIVWENGRHRALDVTELPLTPPPLDDFKPTGTGEPPLAKATDWVRYSATATRETNTMPQWAGSCWYYLRYCDPQNGARFVGKEAESYWMTGALPKNTAGIKEEYYRSPTNILPVVDADTTGINDVAAGAKPLRPPGEESWAAGQDVLGRRAKPLRPPGNEASPPGQQGVAAGATSARGRGEGVRPGGVDLYVGGTEHAVLHLLYARFWHKVLFDLGHVSTPEPFQRLVNQGLILGSDGQKMSKSRGNVVNPDDVISEYGADALRCYEMFMGPLEATKPWSMTGVEGVARFLARVWRLVMEENQAGEWILSPAVQRVEPDKGLLRVLHATVKKVGEDIEELSFNTAISQMMICTNALVNLNPRPISAIRTLLLVLAPFAPHLAEELWARLEGEGLIAEQTWPAYDPAVLVVDEVEYPVQVNGKLRDKITVSKDAPAADIEAAALALPKVAEHTAGKTVRKVIVVPGRLVNIVAT